jgi:glycerol-3-phosphate acyltransferase PlsY
MHSLIGVILLITISYILGAFPTSYILGKLLKGIDLREYGSGNLGAANTFRVLGKSAAIPVLLVDIGKGFLAVKLVPLYGVEGYLYILAAALIVVLGHNYSIFVRFSGGKGIGTTTGAFLAMAPVAVTICFAVWVIVLLLTKIVSVASMISVLLLPISIPLSNRYLGGTTHGSVVYLAVIVAILVIYKHRTNIKRLREGTENKIF